MSKILFIGLGHMGFPMAQNLVRAGYEVWAFDRSEEVMRTWQEQGGHVAPDLSFAREVSGSITMLQTSDQVRSVCEGSEGIFSYLPAGSWWMDCSSIDVMSSRALHQQATDRGLMAVDAPVSGGVKGAVAGSLTLMVGGSQEAFLRVHPILASMGRNIIHAGAAGNGQLAKICNNMILGVSMIAVSESLCMAEQLGLDLSVLQRIVNVSSGSCWVMEHYFPLPDVMDDVPANHGYQPGFTTTMMLKDLKLSQLTANQANMVTPMGALSMQLYEKLTADGLGL